MKLTIVLTVRALRCAVTSLVMVGAISSAMAEWSSYNDLGSAAATSNEYWMTTARAAVTISVRESAAATLDGVARGICISSDDAPVDGVSRTQDESSPRPLRSDPPVGMVLILR